MKLLYLLSIPLLLAAARHVPPAHPQTSAKAATEQAFAQASCGECHAVGRTGMSPRSAAPAFALIANKEGLTSRTLSTWLRGAHNYPREMDFYLGDREVRRLVAYIMTLKDPNYRRPPD